MGCCSSQSSRSGSGRILASDLVSSGFQNLSVLQIAKACFEEGDVKLIRSIWLSEQPENYCLVRCQDLPEEAFESREVVRSRWLEGCLTGEDAETNTSLLIAAISYGWLTPKHPDPCGFYVKIVRAWIKLWGKHRKKNNLKELGLFWDFASLPQVDVAGQRSEEERTSFKKGLKIINAIYGLPFTKVFQIKYMPTPFDGMNATPYDERGWCFFEDAVSRILSPQWCVFDASLARDGIDAVIADGLLAEGHHAQMAFQDFLVVSTSQRGVPIHPEDMEDLLSKKHFTSGSDRNLVSKIYQDFFSEIVSHCCAAEWGHTGGTGGWGPTEAALLARVLPKFQRCCRIDLGEHPIGDEGLAKLVDPLASLPNLVELDLRGTGTFGESGLKHIFEKLPTMKLQGLALPRELAGTPTGQKITSWWEKQGGTTAKCSGTNMYVQMDIELGCGLWHLRKGLFWCSEW